MNKLWFVLVLALPVLLVSCGGDDEPTPPPPTDVLVGTVWEDGEEGTASKLEFYEPFKIRQTVSYSYGIPSETKFFEYSVEKRDPTTGHESVLKITSPEGYTGGQRIYIYEEDGYLNWPYMTGLMDHIHYKVP